MNCNAEKCGMDSNVGCGVGCECNTPVKNKINILVSGEDINMKELEDGPDNGYEITSVNGEFDIAYDLLKTKVDKIVVLSTIQEVRGSLKDTEIFRVDIENNTAMMSEVTDNNTNDKVYILELSNIVYDDGDESKYPMIRTEYLPTNSGGMKCLIYVKPSSKHREILAYMIDMKTGSREQIMSRSHEYLYRLEDIGNYLNVIATEPSTFIATLDSVVRIEGLVYGGILLESGNVIGYDTLPMIENGIVLANSCIYTTDKGVSVKISNHEVSNLTEDESEMIIQLCGVMRDLTVSETNTEENRKKYEEYTKEVYKIIGIDYMKQDIQIILNSEDGIEPISIMEYENTKNKASK